MRPSLLNNHDREVTDIASPTVQIPGRRLSFGRTFFTPTPDAVGICDGSRQVTQGRPWRERQLSLCNKSEANSWEADPTNLKQLVHFKITLTPGTGVTGPDGVCYRFLPPTWYDKAV